MKTLAKEHSSVSFAQAPPGIWQLNTLVSADYGNWRMLNTKMAVSSTYFDLAGLSMQEKTLFFEGAAVQNWVAPLQFNSTGTGNPVTVMDFMTSSPLSDADLIALENNANFAASGVSFDQTIYGRLRQYVQDVDTASWGYLVNVNDQQVGSLKPTASDRVYSYVVIAFGSPISSDTMVFSPCRHLLRAEAREEKDYEYLMRLSRSYQLQNEPDVDGRK